MISKTFRQFFSYVVVPTTIATIALIGYLLQNEMEMLGVCLAYVYTVLLGLFTFFDKQSHKESNTIPQTRDGNTRDINVRPDYTNWLFWISGEDNYYDDPVPSQKQVPYQEA